eukprot:gene2893-5679_t
MISAVSPRTELIDNLPRNSNDVFIPNDESSEKLTLDIIRTVAHDHGPGRESIQTELMKAEITSSSRPIEGEPYSLISSISKISDSSHPMEDDLNILNKVKEQLSTKFINFRSAVAAHELYPSSSVSSDDKYLGEEGNPQLVPDVTVIDEDRNAPFHTDTDSEEVENEEDNDEVDVCKYSSVPSELESEPVTQAMRLDDAAITKIADIVHHRISKELQLRDEALLVQFQALLREVRLNGPSPPSAEDAKVPLPTMSTSSVSPVLHKPRRQNHPRVSSPIISSDVISRPPDFIRGENSSETKRSKSTESRQQASKRNLEVESHRRLAPVRSLSEFGNANGEASAVRCKAAVPGPDPVPSPVAGGSPLGQKGHSSLEAIRGGDGSGSGSGGLRYPHCRSTVFGPTVVSAFNPNAPQVTARVGRVLGFPSASIGGSGGPKGQSGNQEGVRCLFWLRDNQIGYTVANIVVISSLPMTGPQRFFTKHTSPVVSIGVHPDKETVASGQGGLRSDGCRVLIWNSTFSLTSNRMDTHNGNDNDQRSPSKSMAEVETEITVDDEAINSHGLSRLSFSGDGKFLLLLGADSNHTLVIYDWKMNQCLTTLKKGLSDTIDICFNPVLFLPTKSSKEKFTNEEAYSGCYPIISYGKSYLKFWTFTSMLKFVETLPDVKDPLDRGGFKGRNITAPKRKQKYVKCYDLQGTNGVITKLHSSSGAIQISCMCIVDTSTNGYGYGDSSSLTRARIFTGMASGNVYIWEQSEDVGSGGGDGRGRGWLPKGRLVSVVTGVHDNVLSHISTVSVPSTKCSNSTSTSTSTLGAGRGQGGFVSLIATCGEDGLVNVWRCQCDDDDDSSRNDKGINSNSQTPIALISTTMFPETIGVPRSVYWDPRGDSILVVSSKNGLYNLSGPRLLDDEAIEDGDGESDDGTPGDLTINCVVAGGSKVTRLAAHPHCPLICTVSSDGCVRVWDVHRGGHLVAVTELIPGPCCLCFDPSGVHLAVGSGNGEIFILTCSAFKIDTDENEQEGGGDGDGIVTNHDWTLLSRTNLSSRITGIRNIVGNQKHKKAPVSEVKKNEATEVRYAPSAVLLAVGMRDGSIHLLSTEEGCRRVVTYRGHNTTIHHIDFSVDSSAIRSTDTATEVLFWSTTTCKQILKMQQYRDLEWDSSFSVCGWPVQGIYNGGRSVDGCVMRAVCLSPNKQLLVTVGGNVTNGLMKIFRYPCLLTSTPIIVYGYRSAVVDVAFTADSRHVVTVGGSSDSILVWQLDDFKNNMPFNGSSIGIGFEQNYFLMVSLHVLKSDDMFLW